ncbi:hypothetical protein NWFMUON74_69360 [Nocardia wallacei]|uniref:Uncharacterized protein n=1 Tax=Nocardia wallacei TaxID=480035 RepID=A0A7G1L1C3_9NOCA|nr:hypothetical protein NWFMUON74_69360 [Nocardia wallacei]
MVTEVMKTLLRRAALRGGFEGCGTARDAGGATVGGGYPLRLAKARPGWAAYKDESGRPGSLFKRLTRCDPRYGMGSLTRYPVEMLGNPPYRRCRRSDTDR